ncbi:MAG: hypothetical protein L6R39_006279 [Caloplaca ligustica]|nr:MAG: hypothetical protein L6R39_006279 [Caloplaca ligustica]
MVGQKVKKRVSPGPQARAKRIPTTGRRNTTRKQSSNKDAECRKLNDSFTSSGLTWKLSSEEKDLAQKNASSRDVRASWINTTGAKAAETENCLRRHLSELLRSREYPKTICPSEVPRALSNAELGSLGVSDWRGLMDPVRNILSAMQDNGEVEIMQKGEVVDPATAIKDIRGPIRARIIQPNKE